MAELPPPILEFSEGTTDCGSRTVALPGPLPDVGDDIDWATRDFDGFRLAMLHDLAARYPQRDRWGPGDLEVVLVEVLAAALDQLSDYADRVAAETTLPTARRPASVRQLLRLIGYDAAQLVDGGPPADAGPGQAREQMDRALEDLWRAEPDEMESARRAGPAAIATQHRMVTVDDHTRLIGAHPLVLRAIGTAGWTGAWTTVAVTVLLREGLSLDTPADKLAPEVRAELEQLHRQWRLPAPRWAAATVYTLLRQFTDAARLVGTDVVLDEAVPVGVDVGGVITAAPEYFRSEVRLAAVSALGPGPDGFFRPGRLGFGEDVYAGDLMQALTALPGIADVELSWLKRAGQDQDELPAGRLQISGREVAVCENDAAIPYRGRLSLRVQGGAAG